MYEKIVLVTRKTRLEDLIERMNTKAQAKFVIEHAGGDFAEYQAEDDEYRRSLEVLRRGLDLGLKLQAVERSLVPTCLFTEKDLIVALGQDGLVANTAKYVGAQPVVAVNPDPKRFDGVLLPFLPANARAAVHGVIEGKAKVREVTMAEAKLNDGQRLLAFNDLYLGSRTHVSSRYKLRWRGQTEPHSSSGILVSTGAGSTGWMSSVFNMAASVTKLAGGTPVPGLKMDWEDPRLLFAVREPFASKHSGVSLVAGRIEAGEALMIESTMPSGGAIFSDGVEADYLAFNSGAIATIQAAATRARLVVG